MIPVWVYWQGPIPKHIALCLHSIRYWCKKDSQKISLRILNNDDFGSLCDDIANPNWRKIPQLGVISDVVRASLLSKYGGIYLDADTICLKPPTEFYDADKFVHSVWSTAPDRVVAGYVSSPTSQNPIADKWLDNVNAAMKSKPPSKIGWLDLGERCLTPVVREFPDNAKKVPLDTFLPIEIDRGGVQRFFSIGGFRKFVKPHTFCFGLNHSWFVAHKPKEMEPRRIRSGRMVIHSLLRYAESLK